MSDSTRDPLSGDLLTRRGPHRSHEGDRRRHPWRDFRRAYPGFILTLGIAVLMMVAVDAWLVYRRVAYVDDINTLRAHMSAAERQRSDAIVRTTEDKIRIEIELAKRQALSEDRLHLNVSVDSARMYLASGGAILREMPIQFGPERMATPAGDSLPATTPRGERTVAEISDDAITLDGGTRIVAASDALEADSTRVPPGLLRIGRADMDAIKPNLTPGMKVYFY